jgi:uncharacterized protein (DUF488 family)
LGRYPGLQLPTDPAKVQWANKAEWNRERSAEDADFFTVHYAGRSIDDVLQALRAAGVKTVIDIRHAPVSMYKPEFSKSNLRERLEGAGIRYVHLRALGIPRAVRELVVGKADRTDLWQWYDTNVVDTADFSTLLAGKAQPVALLCVEIDPTSCHRHRLGLALELHGLRGYDL